LWHVRITILAVVSNTLFLSSSAIYFSSRRFLKFNSLILL
jgi:hypothetical protein